MQMEPQLMSLPSLSFPSLCSLPSLECRLLFCFGFLLVFCFFFPLGISPCYSSYAVQDLVEAEHCEKALV